MKSLKIKLTTAFIMVAFAIAMLIVGIYAAQTQTITMQGSVNFEIDDKSLYMKDVRIQMDNNSDPTSIDDFMPGYINGDFKMNLGSLTNNYGSFALYFDIVNTINEETQESFYYSPSVTCEQDGISAKVSGAIDIGTVLPENVATADISGTIKLTVINPTETSVDLSKITITISQAEVYTDFVFDDHGTLLSYTGTDTNVIIPSSYAMIGEPTEMTLDIQTEEDLVNNMMTMIKMTNFTYIYDGQEMFFENFEEFGIYCMDTFAGNFPPTVFPQQYYFYDYSNVVFIENNEIPVTAIQGAFAMNATLQSVQIPSGVIDIGFYSFATSSLLSINIPSSVENIGYGAFQDCMSLSSITFGENSQLEYIGDDAFYSCSSLTSIKLPNKLKTIGVDAFNNCPLTSVTIPSSVTCLYYNAFAGSSEIIFEETAGWYLTNVWNDTSLEEFDVTLPENINKLLAGNNSSSYDDAYLTRIS